MIWFSTRRQKPKGTARVPKNEVTDWAWLGSLASARFYLRMLEVNSNPRASRVESKQQGSLSCSWTRWPMVRRLEGGHAGAMPCSITLPGYLPQARKSPCHPVGSLPSRRRRLPLASEPLSAFLPREPSYVNLDMYGTTFVIMPSQTCL